MLDRNFLAGKCLSLSRAEVQSHCLCPGYCISLLLPDKEERGERMSVCICQLNDALQHALLMQLICVLEIVVWQSLVEL